MTMTLLEEYKEKKKELQYLSDAVGLMYWDLQTIAPEGGKEKLSDWQNRNFYPTFFVQFAVFFVTC